VRRLKDARLSTPVRAVKRLADGGAGVGIATAREVERFDAVVLACHSDQALALLGPDASRAEHKLLSSIGYHRNRAVLHTDVSLLPRRRKAWAAWNYEHAADAGRERSAVCLHYLINRLQPLPFAQPVIVSLNPVREPRADRVLAEFDYAHPVFDRAAVDAQRRLPFLQGQRNTWFCGAWTGYGFHEDGLRSALDVVAGLDERVQAHRVQAAA
jgi:predicted NAD/FAD-binding protein